MAYIEKKKINGNFYYYRTTTERVNGKFKKTRKYIGTKKPEPNAETKLKSKAKSKIRSVRAHMTKKEISVINRIRESYSKTHKFNKSLWETEKMRFVSFVYNTNAIEGNTLTLEETAEILEGQLMEHKKEERDVKEVENMKECIDFLFDYNGEFTEDFILKLHYIEQKGIMSDAGKYRNVDVRVGNYLCPHHSEIQKLMSEFIYWYSEAKSKLHPFELASLVHLKSVRIHPFRDGNGRMARLLMNFVLLKANCPLLNIFNDKKTLYYLVLQKYDFDRKERSFVRYLVEVFVGQYKEYV